MATDVLNTPNVNFANLQKTKSATDYSGVLKMVGEMAVEADKGYAEAKLTNELTTAQQVHGESEKLIPGSIAPAADIVSDPNYRNYAGVGINVEENPAFNKELNKFTERLGALKDAKVQGKLNDMAFRMRVEQITREAIARRPGYKQELATVAANELGFDPRGYSLQVMLSDAQEKKSAFEEGQDEARKALGKRSELYKLAGLPEEESLSRGREDMLSEAKRQSIEDYAAVAKESAFLDEGDVAKIVGTYNDNYFDQLGKWIIHAQTSKFASPDGWGKDLEQAQASFDTAADKTAEQLRNLKAYKNNPRTRVLIEDKIAAMRTNVKDQMNVLKDQFDKAFDRKTGSINQELLKMRLDAIEYLRKTIQPQDPGLWSSMLASNFAILPTAISVDAPTRAKLSHYLGILNGTNAIVQPVDKPAPKLPEDPQASAGWNIYTKKDGKPENADEDVLMGAGTGQAILQTLGHVQPGDPKSRSLQDDLLYKGFVRIDESLDAATGAGVQLASGKYHNINAPKVGGNLEAAPNEKQVLRLATRFASDPSSVERIIDTDNRKPGTIEAASRAMSKVFVANVTALVGGSGSLKAYKQPVIGTGAVRTEVEAPLIVDISIKKISGGIPQLVVTQKKNSLVAGSDITKVYNAVSEAARRINTTVAGNVYLMGKENASIYEEHLTGIVNEWNRKGT